MFLLLIYSYTYSEVNLVDIKKLLWKLKSQLKRVCTILSCFSFVSKKSNEVYVLFEVGRKEYFFNEPYTHYLDVYGLKPQILEVKKSGGILDTFLQNLTLSYQIAKINNLDVFSSNIDTDLYRMRGKKFILFYKLMDEKTSLDTFMVKLLDVIRSRIHGLTNYIGVYEGDKNKGNYFLVFLEFDHPLDLRKDSFFDCVDIHPDILPIKNLKSEVIFLLKKVNSNSPQKNLVTNVNLDILKPFFGLRGKER